MNREPENPKDAALHVLYKLRAAGHIALLAGGCVRDMLLGHEPKDYDVVTDATPDGVKEVFPRARQVGARFGVMLVRRRGQDVEVATFRTDGTYSDGRHPDSVTFGNDVEDARRRDFTINGMFFDPQTDRVIDYVDGRADLKAGVIRTIGDPASRFEEDHLRMLRAVRFAARLGFTIEAATLSAIQRHAGALVSVSPERIWQELEGILCPPTRGVGWSLITECGLHRFLASSWTFPADHADKTRRLLAALPSHPIGAALATAAVLWPRPPSEAFAICRDLRQSNRQVSDVSWLLESLPRVLDDRSLELADVKTLMAHHCWQDLLAMLRARLAMSDDDGDDTTGAYDRLRTRSEAVAPEAVSPAPLVTGDDLSELGLRPGPRFGEILGAVYRAQLNETISTKEDAMRMARELAGLS